MEVTIYMVPLKMYRESRIVHPRIEERSASSDTGAAFGAMAFRAQLMK